MRPLKADIIHFLDAIFKQWIELRAYSLKGERILLNPVCWFVEKAQVKLQ